MKFTKPFKGATGGNPYPQDFNVGDECPADLELAAMEAEAVEDGDEKTLDEMTKAELEAYATENGVDLGGVANRKDSILKAILEAAASASDENQPGTSVAPANGGGE
ncbi:hypothetical protein [Hoeflea sp.]|uniref:hypothetical protein n=1 Tax=Hoeflea sp. TaxID=1940281 RepID=UPI003A8E4F91